jgi:hypothetical protein
MIETWLNPNRRILTVALLLPLAMAVCGALLVGTRTGPGYRSGGLCLLLFSALLGSWFIRNMFLPRLGYQRGSLLLRLGGAVPVAVPIQCVECFFLGRANLAHSGIAGLESKVSSVMIRLDETAKDWKMRKIKSRLGSWEEGYIVVRGTWCEPINDQLVASLNKRLRQAHQKCGQQQFVDCGLHERSAQK